MASNAFVEPDSYGKRPTTLVQHKKSLLECSKLAAETVFSGHGSVIKNPASLWSKRIAEIDQKAENYLHSVSLGLSTAGTIAKYHYRGVPEKLFFDVMSEVIGYLDYLEYHGKVTKCLDNGVWHYYPK